MTEQPNGVGGSDHRGSHASRDESVLQRYIGQSAAAGAVRDKLRAIASRDSSVLILGASGTGKELAARIIHKLSARAGGTFLAVDGGALTETLVESELFGHARGAFTGALTERRGLFEEAHQGTLFLDEVGNISFALQAKLLRILESGEVRRVGDNRIRSVNVRVLSATNRDLFAEVKAGRFRDDLLYRLDVLRVELPSLSERREDVPLIAAHFLAEMGAKTATSYALSAGATEALIAYDWPGNVRELRNVLESGAMVATDGRIEVAHLPSRLQARPCSAEGKLTLGEDLFEHEREVIAARLRANRGNRARTARELGISRQCLYGRMDRLGLQPKARRER